MAWNPSNINDKYEDEQQAPETDVAEAEQADDTVEEVEQVSHVDSGDDGAADQEPTEPEAEESFSDDSTTEETTVEPAAEESVVTAEATAVMETGDLDAEPDVAAEATKTAVFDVPSREDEAAVAAEQKRLEAEREERRRIREQALAAAVAVAEQTPAAGDETEAAVVELDVPRREITKFGPSLGLFLMRVVIAGVMGIHGAQKLLDLPAAEQLFGRTILPYPNYFAIGVGIAEVLIALALLLGLMSRMAGLGVALIAGGALALYQWGSWSIFRAGEMGFLGEYELVLAAAGLVLLFVGAGGWSMDAGFRRRRDIRKAERKAGLN